MTTLLAERARAFAVAAHGGQLYGDLPYAAHLDEVAGILDAFGLPEVVPVGYLHDVIEDTTVSAADLTVEFGAAVTAAVVFCSDEVGRNRSERKAATYARPRPTQECAETSKRTMTG